MAVTLLYVCVLLVVLTAPSLTDTCYSTSTGYSECWSGCCGPSDDRDCCSSSGIVIGVAVGGSVILLAFVVVGVCLMCKCHPKFRDASASRHGRDRHRRRERRRDVEGGAWAMRRSPRMVHPVGPPDYSTATQQRAPHVVPTIIPLSPPPPYTETVPPPPTAPPPARDNRTRNHAQQVTLTLSEGGGAQPVATSGTVQGETRTSNKKATQETSQTHKPSAASPCDERGTNVQQTRENGGQRVPAVQQQQHSESAASTVTGSDLTRTVAAATSVAGPSTAAPGSRRALHGIESVSRGAGGGGTGRNSGTLLVVEDLAMI